MKMGNALFYAAIKAYRENELIDADTASELMQLVDDVRSEAMEDGKAMAGANFRFTREEDLRMFCMDMAVKASKSADDVLIYAVMFADFVKEGKVVSSDRKDISKDCFAWLDNPKSSCALGKDHSPISAGWGHITRDGIMFNVNVDA